MNWTVERILHFEERSTIIDGYCHFGFHDGQGNRFILDHDTHWLGKISRSSNTLSWTAGKSPVRAGVRHIHVDLANPTYMTTIDSDTIMVVSSGNNKVFRINHFTGSSQLLIAGDVWGLKDIGNCEYDPGGFLWINEVTGCRVHKFDLEGRLLTTFGNGVPGVAQDKAARDEVQFNWIFDLRRGPDGNIYVLDSGNYCVRMIDVSCDVVIRVAGTGTGGYSGDDGPALEATFGSNQDEHFDGPWSLAIDEAGNLFIGDTQNHVVRTVEHETGRITTIAGRTSRVPSYINDSAISINPLALQLPKICSLDYYNNHLFIPEWDGELIILARSR
ncbi:hypothetical protein P40081_07090 [Paenibacillus sp. FSL P4-0081]|uniref:hypothetical protein n=1 Tax=Paenibacillus sp. FSL P4-0081 TaxID=1536769 RepID=UPI0004F7C7F3|nr:hypothetical protein [Paenibacillus sp. FSL P4-0081]AIQ27968.1 hypothetical protein P40081_07090 [Paenibacillus sp. FSL P4-0081]